MPEGIGGVICGMIFIVAIGTLIGAVILRAAILLYNAMAGGPDSRSSVPEPLFGKAMGIIFVTMLVNAAVNFVMGMATDPGVPVARARANKVDVVAQLASFVVSLLVLAGMLSAMLPTTIGRAIIVTFFYMVICVLVVVVITVALMAFGVALRGG